MRSEPPGAVSGVLRTSRPSLKSTTEKTLVSATFTTFQHVEPQRLRLLQRAPTQRDQRLDGDVVVHPRHDNSRQESGVERCCYQADMFGKLLVHQCSTDPGPDPYPGGM